MFFCAITRPYIYFSVFFLLVLPFSFVLLFADAYSLLSRAGSVDLDRIPSLAPVRESMRIFVDTRKNSCCTRGVVVYLRDCTSAANILGEIIIHARTSLADVRRMIREELGYDVPFVLKKSNIPLPRNQDAKLACWFFSSGDDVLVVVPEP